MTEQTPDNPVEPPPAGEPIVITQEQFDAAVNAAVDRKLAELQTTVADIDTSVKAEPTGYAVYDKTYQRFVGDVVDSRKAATTLAKDRGVKRFEVREV